MPGFLSAAGKTPGPACRHRNICGGPDKQSPFAQPVAASTGLDACENADSWTPAIDLALDAAAAKHALLVIEDRSRPHQLTVTGVRLDAGDLMRFRTPEFLQWVAGYTGYKGGLAPGRTTTWSEIVCDRDFERSPLYNEIVRPAGGFYAIATQQRRSTFTYFLALCRPRCAGDYTAVDTARLETPIAAITAALELDHRLRSAEARGERMAGLLNAIDTGLFLLDGEAQPIFANRAAEGMLAGNGLLVDGCGLRTRDRRSTTALRRHIAFRTPGLVDAERSDGRSPLRMLVTPYNSRSSGIPADCAGVPAVLVMVSDSERRHQATVQTRLKILFGLTTSEAALAAALLKGETIQSFATQSGRTYNTVKTHLRSIFLKTGTSRQADLVRELSTACFFWL